jgi:hypothetical protein
MTALDYPDDLEFIGFLFSDGLDAPYIGEMC